MDLMLFIAVRLKAIRDSKGLTQEKFAEKIGFNYKFYQNLESGRNKYIRMDTVERLAEACDMKIWEFLTPPDPKFLERCSKHQPPKPGRPRKGDSA